MNKMKLLYVENDDHFVFLIKNSFELIGLYDIYIAADGKTGLEMYQSLKPDIIVTAINIPVMDGKKMVCKIRENDIDTLIIFTTSYHEPKYFIEGLTSGADAYIRKPFIAEELNAQIQVLLKRIAYNNQTNFVIEDNLYTIGSFIFSNSGKSLTFGLKKIKLTPTETKILNILVCNKGVLVKREDILKNFGKKKDFFSSRNLDVYIHRLRCVLATDSSIILNTIRGEGFIINY